MYIEKSLTVLELKLESNKREYPIKLYITITTHSQVNTWKIRSNITLMYTYLIAKTIYYKLHYICAYSIGIRVYIETEIDNTV